jgi:hypothetical protein
MILNRLVIAVVLLAAARAPAPPGTGVIDPPPPGPPEALYLPADYSSAFLPEPLTHRAQDDAWYCRLGGSSRSGVFLRCGKIVHFDEHTSDSAGTLSMPLWETECYRHALVVGRMLGMVSEAYLGHGLATRLEVNVIGPTSRIGMEWYLTEGVSLSVGIDLLSFALDWSCGLFF